MTKISKRLLKPFVKEDIVREFWFSLGELKTKEIYALFKEVFSPTEILMVAKRLAILRALREGIDYESIRNTFSVTNTTIAKMNSLVMKLPKDVLKTVDQLITSEKRRWEIFKERRKRAGGVKGSKQVFPRKV